MRRFAAMLSLVFTAVLLAGCVVTAPVKVVTTGAKVGVKAASTGAKATIKAGKAVIPDGDDAEKEE